MYPKLYSLQIFHEEIPKSVAAKQNKNDNLMNYFILSFVMQRCAYKTILNVTFVKLYNAYFKIIIVASISIKNIK